MTVLLQGWRTHSLESIQKLQTQVHDGTACNHNAIPHAVWSGDSCRFLRGSYSLSQPAFKLRLASHTSHSLFTTFFSSGKENNSPQLNQLRTLFFFPPRYFKLFHGSFSSDHKSLLFPTSPNCSGFLPGNFPIAFCPSPSTFCTSVPYLWGIQILIWQQKGLSYRLFYLKQL